MKKMYFTAVLILTAACAKEPQFNEIPQEKLIRLEIPASRAATRTVLADTEGSSVLWCEGDDITVFDNLSGCSGHTFAGTIDDDPTRSFFSGEVHEGAESIYAIYPADGNARISGQTITTTLPSSQTATPGSFANGAALALAGGEVSGGTVSGGLSFANLCSVIAFKTPAYLDQARSVVVAARSGAAIAGSVTIDAANGAITSVSGASSVTLGTSALPKNSTFFVVIAPGTYTNGFTFTVTTKDGNVYTAQTTRTLTAEAGEIYMLGTVGLSLADFTPTVSLTHTYDAGVLTGTKAELTIPGLAGAAAELGTWSVQLKNGDDVVVRSLDAASGIMTVENGYTYLPQGTYTVSATCNLTNGSSIKTRQGSGTTVSPAPSISVTPGGYTSYDCYKGTNGQSASTATANTKDGSTIYDPSVTVNVAPALLQDSKYSHSQKYQYDTSAETAFDFASGSRMLSLPDYTGQSWSSHTFRCSFTFDGVEATAQRNWILTGLPWMTTSFTEDTWEKGSWNVDFRSTYVKIGGVMGSGDANITSKTQFNIPENIPVSVSAYGSLKTLKAGLIYVKTTLNIKLAGSTVISRGSPEKSDKEQSFDNLTGNGTFTPSNCQIFIESTYELAGPYATINMLKLFYR